MTDFAQFALSPAMQQHLAQQGFKQATPVQAASLPIVMAGRDLIAQAKTGSGKTLAFGIPLIEGLDPACFSPQALVLCPTRELADQVAKQLRLLARAQGNIKVLTLCGGVAMGPQIGSLSHGAHVIVGTPGRVEAHLRKGTLQLDRLKTLILDEADRMLEMGFQESLTNILQYLPSRRQTLLFSATFPDAIEAIAANYLHNAERVEISAAVQPSTIEQHCYLLEENTSEEDLILALLAQQEPRSALIFCNTKQGCQTLEAALQSRRISALALHGDLEQKERDQVLVRFSNGSCRVLIATDVAARGLDIEHVDLVINSELSRDPEVHVHRIGRTGRGDRPGLAVSFCRPKEASLRERIEAESGPMKEKLASQIASARESFRFLPTYTTLMIDAGRKQKIRPGDLLGALTQAGGLPGDAIGKIAIFEFCAYIAVAQPQAKQAIEALQSGKVKGQRVRVRRLA